MFVREDVPIAAEIVALENLSAHADADEIFAWLKPVKRPPRGIFVVHGEPAAARRVARAAEARARLGRARAGAPGLVRARARMSGSADERFPLRVRRMGIETYDERSSIFAPTATPAGRKASRLARGCGCASMAAPSWRP